MVAVAAAIGEARGVRIVPQVRRQVPESWRRILPVPLAAGLYGVLLGLGFTTFILTFAVWALAAVSVALGDPALGAVLGLAFGAGRALPVIALAPVAETDRGNAAHAAMAERPAILRGLRVADAVALAACAVAIDHGGARERRRRSRHSSASGPSAEGALVAFQRPGPTGVGYLTRPGGTVGLPGRDPALGAGLVGWRDAQSQIVLARTDTLEPVASYAAPGAGPFAFSDQWVVWLVSQTQLVVQPRDSSRAAAHRRERAHRRAARPPVDRRLDRALPPRRQGRLLDPPVRPRDRPREPAALRAPRAAEQPVVRRPPHALRPLDLHPPGAPPRPLVRRATTRDQALYRTTPTARRDASHEPGHHRHSAGYKGGKPPPLAPRPPAGVVDTLWTTALGPGAAYVTRLRKKSGVTTATLLSVPR